ncbi:MAG: hypothetical protein U0234_17230 [Sandaracinus sp.]
MARFWGIALVLACGCSVAHGVDATADGGVGEGGVGDGGVDGGARDAGSIEDAARTDTGVRDAGLATDAALARCAAPGTRALAVSRGGGCRVDDTGQLWCWGEDDWGQVRPGAPTWVEPREVAYEGLSDLVSVVDSTTHRCVLHRDGGVSCWGDDLAGQVGLAPSSTPVTTPTRVAGIAQADRLVVGGGTSCARLAEARWWCWGGAGYLGPAFGTPADPPTQPFEVPGLQGANRLALGETNAAALFDDGHVEAIHVPDSRIARHYTLPGIDDGVDVESFGPYVCVVRRSGRVSCAGEQTVTETPPAPFDVEGVDDAVAFAHGRTYLEACVVRADGALACWTLARTPAPRSVPAASDVALAAVGEHVCALACDGTVRCNALGRRGENGDGTDRVAPSEVPGLTDAIAVEGRCALRGDATVACWDVPHGAAYDDPCPPPPSPLETQPLLDHVVRLDDGAALRDDGSFRCVTAPSTLFAGAPRPIVDAACGSRRALGITAAGELFAWALWAGGPTPAPTPMATPAPVAELTSRAIRLIDGRVADVECYDFGPCQIGDPWPGLADAEVLWSGAGYATDSSGRPLVDCVRHVGGSVDCRFRGTALDALPPSLGIATPAEGVLVHVPSLDDAAEVLPLDSMLCARWVSGAVECWGRGDRGQLGANDVTVTHTTPVSSEAVELGSAGEVCARRSDGHVVCWGLLVPGLYAGLFCPLPLDRVAHAP